MTGMRWDAQRLDFDEPSTLPGLPDVRGLLRSVQVPEFPGLTFHEVRAKSALNAVPKGSAMPFGHTINPYRGCSHACVYCLSGDTQVLMADGSQRAIAELQVGDRIIGTEKGDRYRRYVETEVLAHWSTVKPAHRVTLADGTVLVASGDHRFLTGRGWKHVTGASCGTGQRPHLTTNDELLGFGRSAPVVLPCEDYRRGYLTGMVRGDAHLKVYRYERAGRVHGNVHRFRLALADQEGLQRSQAYLAQAGVSTDWFEFSAVTPERRAMSAIRTSSAASVARISELIAWPEQPSGAWQRGFLAGVFDAEGSRSQHVLRITNADDEMLERTSAAFTALGFDSVLEDRRLANRVRTVRLRGGLKEHLRFIHLVDPAIRRKCRVQGTAITSTADLRVTEVQDLGLEMPMYDITTGTGDFIANGVVSHNCFARGTHEWLELDSGADFDQQIVVKTNLVDVLRRELARPSWQREHVALGTNTDPYQRAEGRYRLMPGIIDALARSGTPFSVLTKGTLARRDVPRLAAASRDVPVGMGVSMAIWDDDLHAALEPGVPTPRARLDLVRAITDAGLPCGVFLAPVLPGLTDRMEHLEAAIGAIAAAGATGVTVLPLHLRPGAREWFTAWLSREHPGLVGRYRQLYGRGAYVPAEYRSWLAGRVAPVLARYGLDRQSGGVARGVDAGSSLGLPGDESVGFPAGSLPTRRPEPAPIDEAPEQLSLC
ncbi:intein-containing Rv2578c family radical SAM protein [Modestobacter sp. VKM Ac-2979]|uniref:intein-containing Rv2578c family radical SAM protein n=1 Tax=unclassified Modestobacter TaxID=2643866 RepID=UPI0022AB773F|nr:MULTISPECIES: intein-containing Rv2578c family radical SAM protein [unclassified Modestobacter]MCZ2811855.1 intein-containing Rv2578c family radical SAM protein [Modestobacter sp. VKM Ac-2979]MCZ2843578.1 intein-containing Rv2578c family radical SAM protein [Modestobacter sp. VKM Ac-2980]